MTQSFIQPKGSLNTQVNTSGLQQQLAQMFAKQQLQNEATQQAETSNSARQTVQDYLKNKIMQEIEMPKFTTIQDIFNAPKGEKLNTFGSYLNTPSGQNLIGGVLGLLSGGALLGTPDDNYSTYLRNDMRNRQAQALEQQKEQNDIATALNNAYMQQDMAKERNELQRELAKEQQEFLRQEHALDRAMTREHQRNMEGIARLNAQNKGEGARLGTSAAENLSGTYQGIKQMTTLKGKIDQLPSRITTPGIAQISSKNPFDTEAQTFNQYVKTYKQVIGKGLEGGVLRKEDEYKYDQIIPKLGDTKAVLRKKADQLQNMLEEKYSNDMDFYNMAGYNTGNFPTMGSSDSLGLGL